MTATAKVFGVEFQLNLEDLGTKVGGFLSIGSKYRYIDSSGEEHFYNPALKGYFHTPRFKEAIINDIATKYFEYASGWSGHSCQLQVISPKKYEGLTTQIHSAASSALARVACENELKEHINLD